MGRFFKVHGKLRTAPAPAGSRVVRNYMALNEQQVAHGLARFLDAYPSMKSEVESLGEEEAECLGLTLEQLRWHHSHQLLADVAETRGLDEFEFLLEFAIDSPEERTELIAANRDALRRALGE